LDITVQQATVRDLERLYDIERECFTAEAFSKEHIAFLLEEPDSVGLVARINDEVVGFIIGLIHFAANGTRAGHVYTLDVAMKHRRKGIGLRLLKDLEEKFIEKGAKASYLETRMDNLAARELYHKQGYLEVEKLEDYYQKGAHGIRMKKLLAAF
jgi:ribosomal protein S18 acetylase RimI-like enzyme